MDALPTSRRDPALAIAAPTSILSTTLPTRSTTPPPDVHSSKSSPIAPQTTEEKSKVSFSDYPSTSRVSVDHIISSHVQPDPSASVELSSTYVHPSKALAEAATLDEAASLLPPFTDSITAFVTGPPQGTKASPSTEHNTTHTSNPLSTTSTTFNSRASLGDLSALVSGQEKDFAVPPTPNSPTQASNRRESRLSFNSLTDPSNMLPAVSPSTFPFDSDASGFMGLSNTSAGCNTLVAQQLVAQSGLSTAHAVNAATTATTTMSQYAIAAAAAAVAAASNAPSLAQTSYAPTLSGALDGVGSTSQPMSGYPILAAKTELRIIGNLETMLYDWSMDERQERRRLVEFSPQRNGNVITCSFHPVSPGDHKPPNIVVSCIFWEERGDCFITSVDCIHLLESLIGVRFQVEEKNRIRRNLEGFRPITVSKCKSETAEFFKLIMSFPNPKPRNIEKDVKVFPWSTLTQALRKIINKYQPAFSTSAALELGAMQRGGLMLSSPMGNTMNAVGSHGVSTDRHHHRYAFHPYAMARRYSQPVGTLSSQNNAAIGSYTARFGAPISGLVGSNINRGTMLDMSSLSKNELQSFGVDLNLMQQQQQQQQQQKQQQQKQQQNAAALAVTANTHANAPNFGMTGDNTDFNSSNLLSASYAAGYTSDPVSSQSMTAAGNTFFGWPTGIEGFNPSLGMSVDAQQQLRQATIAARRHSVADPYSLRQASQLFDFTACNNEQLCQDVNNNNQQDANAMYRLGRETSNELKQDMMDFSTNSGLNAFP